MEDLQKIFNDVISQETSSEKLIYLYLDEKLKEKGINLSKNQEVEIKKQIQESDLDSIAIDLKEHQLSNLLSKEIEEEVITLDVSEKEVDRFIDNLSNTISNMLPDIINKLSKLLFKELISTSSTMLRYRRKDHEIYSKGLYKTWKRPLDLLESHIKLCSELGSEFISYVSNKNDIPEPLVFDLLARLHTRGCQISNEILCLLKNGYSNGAHARWRSLHEVTTIAAFIGDNTDDLAERYILHEKIESYRAMKQYQRYRNKLGYEPFDSSEVEKITNEYQELKERYGKDYTKPNGWAAQALSKSYVRFSDIEKEVGLNHLRPFYKMASHNVHAGPKGIFFNLSLFPWEGNVLLSGPSIAGLADPGQSCAISLMQLTIKILLHIEPNIDRLVMIEVMDNFTDEICNEFMKINEEHLETKTS